MLPDDDDAGGAALDADDAPGFVAEPDADAEEDEPPLVSFSGLLVPPLELPLLLVIVGELPVAMALWYLVQAGALKSAAAVSRLTLWSLTWLQ